MNDGEQLGEADDGSANPRQSSISKASPAALDEAERKLTADEAFGDVRGKMKFHGELTEPTTDEWTGISEV
jgi:hypothetical protein